MKRSLIRLKESPWREALLAFGSAVIGVVAQVFLESYSAPFLQLSNLPLITYVVTSTLFVLVAVYTITISNSQVSRTRGIQERLDSLTTALGVKAAYIHEPRKKHERATQRITELIAGASKELLVLDYNPLMEGDTKQEKVRRGAGLRHSQEAELSTERIRYYEQIMKNVRESEGEGFHYRRIIQIPAGRTLSDLLHNDKVFREHCHELVNWGEKQPEIASLKQCDPLYEGTYIIIDRRILVLQVEFLGPDNHFLSEGGWFFFDDPVGEFVGPFVRFFLRADRVAKLVTPSELYKSESA